MDSAWIQLEFECHKKPFYDSNVHWGWKRLKQDQGTIKGGTCKFSETTATCSLAESQNCCLATTSPVKFQRPTFQRSRKIVVVVVDIKRLVHSLIQHILTRWSPSLLYPPLLLRPWPNLRWVPFRYWPRCSIYVLNMSNVLFRTRSSPQGSHQDVRRSWKIWTVTAVSTPAPARSSLLHPNLDLVKVPLPPARALPPHLIASAPHQLVHAANRQSAANCPASMLLALLSSPLTPMPTWSGHTTSSTRWPLSDKPYALKMTAASTVSPRCPRPRHQAYLNAEMHRPPLSFLTLQHIATPTFYFFSSHPRRHLHNFARPARVTS